MPSPSQRSGAFSFLPLFVVCWSRPYLIRTRQALKEAVAACAEYGAFVIDVETDGLFTKENMVTWVGLATHGQSHLIPIEQL